MVRIARRSRPTGTMKRTLLVVLLANAAPVFAQAADAQLRAAVVQKELAIDVELAGVFEAEEKDEVRMEPKDYRGDLIITKILPEGSAVKKGELLIEFDEDSLTRALEDARNEATDAEVELKKAQSERDALVIEQTTALGHLRQEITFTEEDLAAARKKAEIEITKKEREIKRSQEALADAEVDFEQLLQLYKERELHTATENILIDREKRQIEERKRALEVSTQELEIFKQFEHNRDVQKKQIEVEKKQAELKTAEVKNGANLAEKDSAVTKAERKLKKAQRKVEELAGDQKSLRVESPRDGILFYGQTGDEMPAGIVMFGQRNNEMRVGGRVRTHEVLMTVAAMEKLAIKMRALENDIQHMKEGLPISVVADAFPSLKIEGKLTKVDQVASRQGFLSEVREFSVKGSYDGIFPQLRAGMNCRVTVHADSVPEAIQVPIVAVFQDKGEHCCYVEGAAGGASKRKVKIGVSNGSQVQIVEGLKPDEKVLLYDPNRS